MHVLRPIREDDLPALVALARGIAGTLTTLPPDAEFLRERIDESLHAFRPRVRQPGGEVYLFVLEDTTTRTVVGTSGIVARVGGFEPFYSYELRTEHHAHAPLGITRDVEVLHLKQQHRGPTEIGSLYLQPAARRGGLGRLLSLGRFLFVGAFAGRFDETVIAELRGVVDADGRSPFWEAVGRQFFGHDFYEADLLSGLGQKQFIADLMPRHPIYVPLLPPAVQAVIGRVHHETEPALALLRAEGFEATREVDIFDAGPQVRATTAEIRTIRETRRLRVVCDAEPKTPALPTHLIARPQLAFRACLGAPRMDGDEVHVAPAVLDALEVQPGDEVLVVSLRSGTTNFH